VIAFGSRLFDPMNFLLTSCDVRGDRVLGADDVVRRVGTPIDGIPKLLLVLLHRLSCPINCSST
jgi:hypothetical protein